jgi:hypothetical protein
MPKMSFLRKLLITLLTLTAGLSSAYAIDKDDKKFTPPPVESITAKQTNDGVTVAAVPYTTEEQAKAAFGKLNPYKYGVLPVLVVVKNDSPGSVRISNLKVEYIDAARTRIEATPAADVRYARSPERPNFNPSPIPGLKRSKKNPLDSPDIEVRAFSAKMLPPGESAYGFVYFQTGKRRGDHIYITGFEEASTGKEFLYFDIALD